MTIEELTIKYIKNSEHVLREMKIVKDKASVTKQQIESVIESAKNYLEDANYYKKRNKFETSLASVAYCEGLLDAVRLLGMVNFQWPEAQKENIKRC